MASFAPVLNEQDAPSQIGFSQGPGVPRFGELFAGLGNVLESVGKAKDLQNQSTIRKEATADVRTIQDMFGASDAATVAVGQPGVSPVAGVQKPVPTELSQAASRLAVIQKGLEQGTIKPSHYYGLLNAKTKELRAKYPGYEDYIDNVIQNVAGVDPANATLSALRQEANDAASQADAKTRQFQAFVDSHNDAVVLTMPDYFENPGKYSETQVRANVAKFEAQKTSIDYELQRINLQQASNNLSAAEAEKSAYSVANQTVAGILDGTVNSVSSGSTYKDLQESLRKYQTSGTQPSPQEQAQVLGNIQQMKNAVTTQLLQTFATNEGYSRNLDAKKRSDIITAATQPFDMMMEAYTNKDYGVLSFTGAYVKAQQTQTEADLVKKYPILPMLNAVKNQVGDNAVNIFLGQNPQAMTALSQVLVGYAAFEGLGIRPDGTPAIPTGNVNDQLKRLSEYAADPSVDVNSKAPNLLLDTTISYVTSGDKNLNEKAARHLFLQDGGLNLELVSNQNYKGNGTGSPQDRVFSKLTAPAVTAAIKQMPDDVQKGYYKWATKAFMSRMTSLGNTMAQRFDAFPDLENAVQLYLDPATGQIVSKETNDLGDNPELTANARDVLYMDVRDLNVALSGMKGVYELGGGDPAKAMEGTLRLINVPLLPGSQGDANPSGTQYEQLTPNEFRGVIQPTSPGNADLTYTNQNSIRNQKIQPDLADHITSAVAAVYGPGYHVEVYSGGQGETGRRTGSVRHNHGRAADIYVVGPNGERVTGDALAPLGQYWAAEKYGGVGMEMHGGGVHLDNWSTPPKGGGMSWNYARQRGRFTPAQREAIAAGRQGKLPDTVQASEVDPDGINFLPSESQTQFEATGITESGGPVGFLSSVFGGTDTPLLNSVNARQKFPTPQDAQDFLKSDPFYGQDNPFLRMRVFGDTFVPNRKTFDNIPFPLDKPTFFPTAAAGEIDQIFNDLNSEDKAKVMALPEEVKVGVGQALVAMNRSAIATLGFAPKRVVLDLVNGANTTIGGAYNPPTDTTLSLTAYPSNLMHESIHRGFNELRKEFPEEVKKILGDTPEETFVRWLMLTEAGNPEQGSGPVADSQIKGAQLKFDAGWKTEAQNNEERAKVTRLNEFAQQLIKKRRPRGPR